MKSKKWCFLLIGLLILSSLSLFGQTKKLRDIGRYKFIPIKAGTPAPEIMKVIAEEYAGDIQRGFDLAGYPNLYPPFMEQVRQSIFTKTELAVGSRMAWMIFRSGGKIKVVHDLEWAGQDPLPIFVFSIQEGDQKYEIIMPESCGNISLLPGGPVRVPAAPPQPPPYQEKPEDRHRISKAKIYQDIADLINEVDLYCSFSVWEDEIPGLRIIGAEREYEKSMSSDGDIIYLNKGKDGGIEPGQIFWILDISEHLPGYGRLAFGTGWARVQHVDDTVSAAVVEHSCHGVRDGYYLVPLEEKEGLSGKDLGYEVPPVEAEGAKGRFVYLQGHLEQIGSYQWALVDIGAEQGIQVGQQLILYRRIQEDLPVSILGNCVVIDVKSQTSTIKVLSCRDVVRRGDLIMERPPQ
jgi:hypothetical protein